MSRKLTLFGLGLAAVTTLLLLSSGSSLSKRQAAPSVALGEHLVTILACNDCHTPHVVGEKGLAPDMSRMLSGHPQDVEIPDAPVTFDGAWGWIGSMTNTAFAGPWGISFAANLTPHEHGLQIWTEQMFIDALRTGRHMGQSRPIQPPMPWPAFGQMTDHELRSVFAYLRSIPPVDNLVPDWREPGAQDDGWEH